MAAVGAQTDGGAGVQRCGVRTRSAGRKTPDPLAQHDVEAAHGVVHAGQVEGRFGYAGTAVAHQQQGRILPGLP